VSDAGRYRNYSSRARRIARAMDLAVAPLLPLIRAAAPARRSAHRPRSILVVRLDHVGDVLMSTPAIAALRHAHPDARIDVLAAAWGKAALESSPHVDRVREGIAPWYEPGRGGRPSLAALARISAALREGGGYDWAFDFRGDPRVILFYLLPAAGRRFGFSRLGLERLLTDSLPYDRRRSMLDLCLDLVAAGGASPVGRRPVYRVSEAARTRAQALLDEAELRGPFAVIAPGANRAAARWGAEGFAGVATALRATGLRIVLVGRTADAAATRRVAETMSGEGTDLTGRTGLDDLAAILERASVLVCNDSGSAHLAAAVDCPTVAVFGPTDPALTFPYADGRRFVSVATPIDHPRPCFRAGCASDHGFSRVTPHEVSSLALRVLREPSAGRRP